MFLNDLHFFLPSRYEKIFGPTYVSTGGQATTTKFCNDMELSEDKKVLDIGCGIGGSAFYMARKYGCLVNGIDLSTNMINIANAYRYVYEGFKLNGSRLISRIFVQEFHVRRSEA